MCLDIDRKIHPPVKAGKTVKVLVAGYDILTYKVLRPRVEVGGLSPYMDHLWYFGKTEKTKMRLTPLYLNLGGSPDLVVNEGLHSFMEESDADASLYGVEQYYPAIIPKGTRFFIGTDGDIVSEALVVYETLEDALQGRDISEPQLKAHTSREAKIL